MSAPPSPDLKRWPALLLLAAAICPPLATWLASLEGITIHGLTDNPWSSFGLFVLYEIALAMISVGTKVWGRLEGTWLDQFSLRVDHFARRLVSGYDHHYREYFHYEHRDLDVKGLGTQGAYTLDLEHVFVELRIDATPVHNASANPLRLPRTLLEGSHTIWDYLQVDQHIVVLGAPGNGKTTLLKHLGLCLLHHKPHHRRHLAHTLPVLLFLREHSKEIAQNPAYALPDAVRASTTKWNCVMPPGWIERHLDKGHCLMLLDGLDEVADVQTRRQVVAWVQQQMIAYHRNLFIVTSRPYGYRTNPLDKVMILEVQSFTPAQIDKFVRNWYLANEIKSAVCDDPGVHMKANEAAEELLRRLRDTPGLLELAVNPLLLTMIATVHRYRGSLPGTRVTLYKEICEVFLGKRQEARGIEQEMRPEQRQLVLQALAYQMMLDGIREIAATKAQAIIQEPLRQVSLSSSPHTFLQSIEHVSGLLLEREQGVYIFAHQTFQEYLTMMHIREQHFDQQLVLHVDDTWWHEVIRLYCAHAEATPIIDACLQRATASVPALVLALECAGEALSVQPQTAKKLQDLLASGQENPDPERRRVVVQALLTRRLKQMVQSKEELYVDTSLITCAEYQLFVDDQQAKGKWHQPDHWEHASFETGLGQQPVLGIRPSDAQAFCTWLTQRESSIWQYRLPKKGEVQPETIHPSTGWQTPSGFWEDGEDMFTWITRRSMPNGQPTQKKDLYLYPLDLDLRNIRQVRNIKERSRVINFDRALARDLALDLARALASARDLARDLDRDLNRDLDCASTLALDLALDRASDRASTLDLDLALDLALDLDHASTLALDLARASALDLDLALALDLDLALARASDLDLARASDLDLARASTRALTKTSLITIELARMHNHTHRKDFIILTQIFVLLSRSIEHLFPVYNMLLSNTSSTPFWKRLIPFQKKRGSPPPTTQELNNLDLCNEIMSRLEQLERRQRGEEPAYEGLLIVKERKEKFASSGDKR